MTTYDEIRQQTRKLLRQNIPSVDEYKKALPLCKELWAHFSDTQEFWDAHQYANCLKKLGELDEAENVCEYIYQTSRSYPHVKNALFPIVKLYVMIINDKYVKSIRKPDYQYEYSPDKLFLLHEIIEFVGQDSRLLHLTIVHYQ